MSFLTVLTDLIIVLLVVLSAVLGRKKGGVATVISLVGGIAALAVTLFLTPPVGAFLSENVLTPALTSPIEETIRSAAEQAGEPVETFLEERPRVEEALSRIGIQKEKISDIRETGLHAFSEKAAGIVSAPLAYGLTFFVLFIVLLLLVRLIIRLTKKLNAVPVVGGVNRTLGLVFGILFGLVLAWAFAAILHLFVPYLHTLENEAARTFDEDATFLYRYLYRFQPMKLLREVLG